MTLALGWVIVAAVVLAQLSPMLSEQETRMFAAHTARPHRRVCESPN
jgi:hypothetical protein